MSMPQAFVQAIAESLYDDTPRLVHADWLEEHGDPARAEFIRVQCELDPVRGKYEIERVDALHRREDELLRKHGLEWVGQMPEGWYDRRNRASATFRRGFVDTVSMPVRAFLELGEEVRRRHPTIRRVVLFRVNGRGERLAACPALNGLAELELACWYSDADAGAIAASPYLDRLQVLELWLGRRDGLSDSRLCRTMAASRAWPRLRELTLLDLDRENDGGGESLADTANRAAGRQIAVYRLGYLELFPFAADFRYAFPGHLPDGRMAMAREDRQTSPPTLCVLTFDREGTQTDDVLTVPLPADLLEARTSECHEHRDRLRQHLSDVIGFRPGFIRIRGCHFPGDTGHHDSPSWAEIRCIGRLDSDDADDGYSWQEHPRGAGGEVNYVVRRGQYLFGRDRRADKRGRVHST